MNEPDSILFWVLPRESHEPVYYKVPFTKELKGQILEAQEDAKKNKGVMIFQKKISDDKGSGIKNNDDSSIGNSGAHIKVVDPKDIMKKN
jgi:hypothetical protein